MNFFQSQYYEAGDQLVIDETDFYVLAAEFAALIEDFGYFVVF